MQIHRITARQALNHVGGDPYDYDLNIARGCAHRCRNGGWPPRTGTGR